MSAACDAHRSHTHAAAHRTLPSARTGRRRPRSTEHGTPTTTRHCVSDDAASTAPACLAPCLRGCLLCCALPALPVRQLAGPHHMIITHLPDLNADSPPLPPPLPAHRLPIKLSTLLVCLLVRRQRADVLAVNRRDACRLPESMLPRAGEYYMYSPAVPTPPHHAGAKNRYSEQQAASRCRQPVDATADADADAALHAADRCSSSR